MSDDGHLFDTEDHAKRIIMALNRIKDARGISVAELARRAGIDSKRLWYILDGQRNLRADEFVRLCIVLNVGMRPFLPREMAIMGKATTSRATLFPDEARTKKPSNLKVGGLAPRRGQEV